MRVRRVLVIAAATAMAIGTWQVLSMGSARAGGTTPQIAGSVAAPGPTETSPICAAPDPTATLGPSVSLPSAPVSPLITSAGGLVNFTATPTGLYVDTGSQLVTYSLGGTTLSSFALPALFPARNGVEISPPVVDPAGNIYLASYYDQVVDKFSPTGQLLWSADPESGNPTGLYDMGSGAGFELVASVVQDKAHSDVLNQATGSISGTFPLVDDLGYVTTQPGGGFLSTGNGYVQTVDATGKTLATFGSSATWGSGSHTGGGTQFFEPSQAVQGPDGIIYTADPQHTIEATSPTGDLLGTTTLGGALTFGGDTLYLEGSTLYFEGTDNISTLPLATLQAYLGAAHVPTDSLGWGAGLTSSAAANYFAPGTTPSVTATFDPWWLAQASHLELTYSVEDTSSLTAESVPAAVTVPLPATAAGLAQIPLAIPTQDRQPGPYLVQASLLDTATSPPTHLGTTCLPYTVGAPGDGLDLASLPSGIGAGGPSDPRGVALNAQLGLDGLRGATIDWSTLLPHCSASSPTPATCGPTAVTFAGADSGYFQAAYLAGQDHVTYWLQATGGGPLPMALVANGWWQADVSALVSHYATVPADCGPCAPVTRWEPWNEPNNTGWANASAYVTQVLRPFYQAVKQVLPGSGSTVIGGSSLNMPTRLVEPVDRQRRTGLPGRRLGASLHRQQRLVRRGWRPCPRGATAGHAGRHAAVVHRGRLVGRRGLRLPQPGQ